MKIYIVMINDRHSDPEPYPFETAEAAIDFARNQARELCRHGEPEETEIRGWLFHSRFSVEGDSVWVVAKELVSS
jgi:hypothetical protein